MIDFMKSNLDTFGFALKGRAHDLFGDCTTNSKEDRLKVLTELAKDGVWAGAESIKAIAMLYNVNVFIIYENHWCELDQFNEKSQQCIILAYRYLNSKDRIHYDSVIDIERETVRKCIEFSKERIYKRHFKKFDANHIITI